MSERSAAGCRRGSGWCDVAAATRERPNYRRSRREGGVKVIQRTETRERASFSSTTRTFGLRSHAPSGPRVQNLQLWRLSGANSWRPGRTRQGSASGPAHRGQDATERLQRSKAPSKSPNLRLAGLISTSFQVTSSRGWFYWEKFDKVAATRWRPERPRAELQGIRALIRCRPATVAAQQPLPSKRPG